MKTVRTGNPGKARDHLVREISYRLEQNSPVLLLLSGGSTSEIAVEVCAALLRSWRGREDQLRWIMTLSLGDERFGPEGHSASNWQLLADRGLDRQKFSTIPVLHSASDGREALDEAVSHYRQFIELAAEKHRKGSLYIAALLGIGAEGQIAGILPDSPASRIPVGGTEYSTMYRSALFRRITIAPPFFPCIDRAVVWASGSEKKYAIESLSMEIPVCESPAQLLKLAAEATVYTDSADAGTGEPFPG